MFSVSVFDCCMIQSVCNVLVTSFLPSLVRAPTNPQFQRSWPFRSIQGAWLDVGRCGGRRSCCWCHANAVFSSEHQPPTLQKLASSEHTGVPALMWANMVGSGVRGYHAVGVMLTDERADDLSLQPLPAMSFISLIPVTVCVTEIPVYCILVEVKHCAAVYVPFLYP